MEDHWLNKVPRIDSIKEQYKTRDAKFVFPNDLNRTEFWKLLSHYKRFIQDTPEQSGEGFQEIKLGSESQHSQFQNYLEEIFKRKTYGYKKEYYLKTPGKKIFRCDFVIYDQSGEICSSLEIDDPSHFSSTKRIYMDIEKDIAVWYKLKVPIIHISYRAHQFKIVKERSEELLFN